jgi:hypothetical protein
LHILPNVDKVYLIADGTIAASGTYDELVQNGYSLENILHIEDGKQEENGECESTSHDQRRPSASSHAVSLGETQALGICEDNTGDLYMAEEMSECHFLSGVAFGTLDG